MTSLWWLLLPAFIAVGTPVAACLIVYGVRGLREVRAELAELDSIEAHRRQMAAICPARRVAP